MTIEEGLAQLLWYTAGTGAVYVALRHVLMSTVHAYLRHDLFAIRRELFLLMADGKVSLHDPLYQELRTMLNELLKRAEHLHGFDVLVIWKQHRLLSGRANWEATRRAIERHPAWRELAHVRVRALRAIILHLMRLTPFSVTLMAFMTWTIMKHMWRFKLSSTVKRAVRAPATAILSEAMQTGQTPQPKAA